MLPDGTGEHCVSCDLYEFRKQHAFDPVWSPSGEYIVFTVQRNSKKLGMTAGAMTTPDRGIRGDLWILDRTGKYYFQLTRSEQTSLAVLAPRFSHEGGRLLWSERVTTKGGRWGDWRLRVARITIDSAVPRLRKVETYNLGTGKGFVEGAAFSPDDRRILLAGNLEAEHGEAGMDLYLFDLESEGLQRLTATLGEWDELGEFAPTGEHIAFTSNRNLPRAIPRQTGTPPSARTLPRELWLMAPDGSGQQRLTFFNHPAAGEGPIPDAVVADLSWSPNGDQIAIQVVRLEDNSEAIYIVDLHESFRR
jgi:Tol biopolymer transport system component